jgi:hypothetical protein
MAMPTNERPPHRGGAADRRDQADRVLRGQRRVRCLSGPADGTRWALDAGATEHVVALQRAPNGEAREAVYRVQRRRRGRGPAYVVLVFAGYRIACD